MNKYVYEKQLKSAAYKDASEFAPSSHSHAAKNLSFSEKNTNYTNASDIQGAIEDIDGKLWEIEGRFEQGIENLTSVKADKADLGGMIEITDNNPINNNTVLLIDPNQTDALNIYTAEEVNALLDNYTPSTSNSNKIKIYFNLLEKKFYLEGPSLDRVFLIEEIKHSESGMFFKYECKLGKTDDFDGDLVSEFGTPINLYNSIITAINEANGSVSARLVGLYNEAGYGSNVILDYYGGLAISFGNTIIRFQSSWAGSVSDPS